MGWKLPKALVVEDQLQYYVNQINSFHNSNQSHHHITLILVGELAKKKTEADQETKDQLNLVQQQKKQTKLYT